MDLALPLLPGVLMLGAVAPLARRIHRLRAAERDALRYLEMLLVEARSCSYPVAYRRI